MRYCSQCLLPDTRPNLQLNANGICNACLNHKENEAVNWQEREQQFQRLVDFAIKKSSGYDCLIPVSGGKDSHWQVIQCLKYGLKPLCYTWRTPGRTKLGQENLDNLIRLGVDHVEYQVNPRVEKKFMLKTFRKAGSTAIPMHMAIHALTLQTALRFNIPLIIWGENSAQEYGHADPAHKGVELNENWFRHYGVTQGTTAVDWAGEDLSLKDLTPYLMPDFAELSRRGIHAAFLGYYFPWDVELSYKAALETGFKSSSAGAKTGIYDYADIDDDFISLHHYLKWHKFGFTRTYDNLSLEIRKGRLTRAEALEILRKKSDETPYEDIKAVCEFMEISTREFFQIAETFRNMNIWIRENNVWKIKGFIFEDWNWKGLSDNLEKFIN